MSSGGRLAGAFDLDTSHLALAVARIGFFAAVLGELVDLFAWRRLSYLPQHAWVADVLLPVHILVVAAILLGWRTRLACLLNYPLAFVVLGAARNQYHFDAVVENLSFVFLFAPAPRCLALDARRAPEPGATVPRSFTALLFVVLELTYADSLHFKAISQTWTSGAAFWLGAANPPFSTGRLPDALEIGWLMRACTYAAFAYEALFPLVFVRAARPVIVALGILVHGGIAVFYPLPWFGLGLAALVAAFLPRRKSAAVVPALSGRAWAIARYAACVAMIAAQVALARGGLRGPVHEAMGVYRHPIFYDWHFGLKPPVLAFRAVRGGAEVAIPSFGEDGRPQVRNRYWTLLGFLVRGAPQNEALARRYVAAWYAKEGWEAGPCRVYAKEVALDTMDLDFGMDDRIEAAPWRLVGEWSITPAPLPGDPDAPLRVRSK